MLTMRQAQPPGSMTVGSRCVYGWTPKLSLILPIPQNCRKLLFQQILFSPKPGQVPDIVFDLHSGPDLSP